MKSQPAPPSSLVPSVPPELESVVVRCLQKEPDQRFAAIEVEYRKAPGVTRQRLYTETMERVLRNSNKVLVDNWGPMVADS